eukprot:3157068-Alexandrium_andersonii.AAC.1
MPALIPNRHAGHDNSNPYDGTKKHRIDGNDDHKSFWGSPPPEPARETPPAHLPAFFVGRCVASARAA